MQLEDLNNDEKSDSSTESFDESDGAYVDGQKKTPKPNALAVVGLLVVVAAGAWFFFLKKGPETAAADTTDQTAASATINDFLHGNGGNAKLMEQTLHDTEKVVQEFQSHSKKNQVPVEHLQTNPFRLREPKPVAEEVVEAVPSRVREDEERQRIVADANALELQSVVRGGRSACLLNNNLYHVGDQIGSFTVEEIRPKSIIVRQGKYRFELTMKK